MKHDKTLREIKFRVWSKKKKTMYYLSEHIGHPDRLHLSFNNSHWGLFNDSDPVCLANSTFLDVLMQYTGLKDSEDREIYEGDVIKRSESICGNDCVGFVEYEVGVFWFKSLIHKIPELLCDQMTDSQVDVIGNIYDNPELLEVPK